MTVCQRTEMSLGTTPATPCLASCFMTLSGPEQFTIQIYLCMYLYRMQTLGDTSTPLTAESPDSR